MVLHNNIDSIPRLKLLTFIKNNLRDINDNKDMKNRVFNLMGNIQDLFGKSSLQELNSAFLKEFEQNTKEQNKMFSQFIKRLKDKNARKRKLVLKDIEELVNPTMM